MTLRPSNSNSNPVAGLPSANPTRSYWLRDPSRTLLGHRGTPALPEKADVVVVGSGITGAFAALFLKEGEEGRGGGLSSRGAAAGGGCGCGGGGGGGGGCGLGSAPGGALGKGEGEVEVEGKGKETEVVMLEAREACWGATGRNGGHCQPLVYGSVPAVAAFELEVFEFLERLVKEEGVGCDWVSMTGVHAFLSQDMFELAAAEVERLKQSHPELAAQLEVVRRSDKLATGEQTLASLRVPSANGAIIQKKAASLWPYKLVAWILERLLSKFPAPSFNLQTNTPVTSLDRHPSGTGWILTTPRGKITARQVLLATNGYTSHLLPAFSDLIVPVRGQIGALLPPTDPAAKLLHSYVFVADPEDADSSDSTGAPRDDYLVQRPLPTGELIYGGGRRFARDLGVGEWRDDELEDGVARYLRGNLSPPLDLTTPGDEGAAGRGPRDGGELEATFEWTGIMGYSRDHHAWVGPVPENLGGGGPRGGLWICAGYTGHGMPAAALSAREVVRQMMGAGAGAEESGVRLPEEFVLSEERVERARRMPQLTQGWEATNLATLIAGMGGPVQKGT
ncbi:hypothetical protein VTK56DRAFT_1357 [Thermocarpiscus australiensis]